MKYFVTFSLIVFLAASVLALPDKQDAKRFEVAASTYKLVQEKGFKWQKLLAELKNEISVIKYEQDKAAFATQVSGTVASRALLTSDKAQVDYRLKYSLLKNFSQESSLKINLDTIDAANTARDPATRLVDIESRFKISSWDWTINVGPGPIVHTEPDNIFPSEDNTVFDRPRTGVNAKTRVEKFDFSAGYVTHQVALSGLVGVHELTSKLGYHLGKHYLYFQPHYLFVIDGARDVLVEAGLNCGATNILLGHGGRSQYLRLAQKIGPWLELSYSIVGENYRTTLSQNELVTLNNFNKYILDGTADFGVKITQKLNKQIGLELTADKVTGQNESLLWQAELAYENLGAFYRNYNGTGLLGLTLAYAL